MKNPPLVNVQATDFCFKNIIVVLIDYSFIILIRFLPANLQQVRPQDGC